MKLRIPLYVPFALLAIIIAAVYSLQSAQASAPAGLMATVATSSNPTVTTTAALVFATSSCAARIITTAGASTSITFADTPFGGPTTQYGHYQAANTTVVYDGGQFGCGALRIVSAATQAITVTETR